MLSRIAALALAAFLLFRRPFCRGVCPIGAVFAVLNRFSLLRVRVSQDRCRDCGACEKKCPVDNHVGSSPAHQDCIRCFECIDNCGRKGVEMGLARARARPGYWE